ncbi:hypothetical protein BDF14DRAFT_1780036 [Spinellus fusiger]|nr:hypothetical protein BDF14DRAFT_1780036 [Spinellus fusiger]
MSTMSNSSTNYPVSTPMSRSGSNLSVYTASSSPAGRMNRSRQNTQGEEDISRNISADYQEIQMRTLTKWVNVQLQQVNDSITSIATDLRDGKRLLKLLAVVSKDIPPKPERMNMRIHQLSNVAQALHFLETQLGAEAMPDIGNEAIVNGDTKKTLALLFFIMLKYQIQLILSDHGKDYGTSLAALSSRRVSLHDFPLPIDLKPQRKSTLTLDKSPASTATEARVALLFWVRIQLEDYIAASIIPTIQDFSRSWRTGLVFCLLIHRHDPLLIPDILSRQDTQDRSVWLELLTLAFDIASSHMGISNYLEPADLMEVDHPHEPSVMMYVSEYYKVMSSAQKQESQQQRQEKTEQRRALVATVTGMPVDSMQGRERISVSPVQEEESVLATMASRVPSPPSEAMSEAMPEPVPVPMPSARRKLPHRQSTLKEEDKVRIKADLNSRLMMQLTGHLPRGVHPILDQLLTLHDALTSFIRTSSRAMDEMPEEFMSSSAVSECVEILETIESQAAQEASGLDTAKEAKVTLVTPAETADDTLIRLTDHQKDQVNGLYEDLVKEWKEFYVTLQSTKSELQSMELFLNETENGVREFQKEAEAIEQNIHAFAVRIVYIPPRDAHDHPIHAIDASSLHSIAYETALADTTRDFDTLELQWRMFRAFLRNLSPSVLQLVNERNQDIQKRYEHVETSLRQAKHKCTDYKRAMAFSDRFQSLHQSLDAVQERMDSNERATTNAVIVELENKVSLVRSTLYASREEFNDLLSQNDMPLQECFDAAQDHYIRVRDWVDQIRQWFGEAERISQWIETRTQLLQERAQEAWDPLSEETLSERQAERVRGDHRKLQREIEQFNLDDMARLRAHVKTLTATDRISNLSPADTSTIEITLVTLNALNHLLSVLGEQTRSVDLLSERLQWEQLFKTVILWIDGTDEELTEFLHEKAWWHEGHTEREPVITGLVAIEQHISAFDKGDYARLLEYYQKMEDITGDKLPEHLESRQSNCETSFAELMTRCGFARKVVEQYLVLLDVMNQCHLLQYQGEQLHQTMTEPCTPEQDIYGESIKAYKEAISHWTTQMVSQVPFPEEPNRFQDQQDQLGAHTRIQTALDQQSMSLALSVEGLEELLSQYRQTLSLQQRADLVYDEMAQLTSWMMERTRTLEKDCIYDVDTPQDVFEHSLERLDKEYQGICARLQQIEQNDLAKARETVQQIENEMAALDTTLIEQGMLIDGIEALEESYKNLVTRMEERESELSLGHRFLEWQLSIAYVNKTIVSLSHSLWDFISRQARYDSASPIPPDRDVLQQWVASVEELCLQTPFLPGGSYDQLIEEYTVTGQKRPPHVEETQQQTLNKKEELKSLTYYATELVSQHEKMDVFLTKTRHLLDESQTIRDTIVKWQRHTEQEEDVDALDQRMMDLEKDVHELWNTKGSVLPYPKGQLWLQPDQPHAWVMDHNSQLSSLVQRHHTELVENTEAVRRLWDLFSDTTYKRQLRLEYEQEIAALQQWVDTQVQQMQQRSVQLDIENPTQVSKDTLTELSEAHTVLLKGLEEESTCLAPIQEKTKRLNSSKDEDLLKNLDHLFICFHQLQQDSHQETFALAIAHSRLSWEETLQSSSEWLDTMHEQLRQCTAQKNKWLAQDDGTSDWASTSQQVKHLEQGLTAWHTTDHTLHEHYKAILDGLAHRSRPIPEHVHCRMENYTRVLRKLKDTVESRRQELLFIEKRCAWEEQVHKVMQVMEEQAAELNEFVECKARWTHQTQRESSEGLRHEWQVLEDKCTDYEATITLKLKTTLAQLKQEASMYTPPLISETLVNKLQEVLETNEYLQRHKLFSQAIVNQCCAVNAFLLETERVEGAVEDIREEFLTAEHTEESESLDKVEADIEHLKKNATLTIVYPVRTDHQQSALYVKDDTTHTIIRDMVNMKLDRLTELAASLRQFLVSRASITRFQMAQQDYENQLRLCNAWIDTRFDMLKSYEPLIVQEDVDHDALRHAVSGAESMQAAMQGSISILHSLTAALEKCRLALKELEENTEEQYVHNHTTTKERWNALETKACRLAKDLTAVLIPAEHMHSTKKLLASCCTLQDEINATESSLVTDEQVIQWQHLIDHLESKEYNTLQQLSLNGFQGQALVRMQKAKQLLEQAGEKIMETRALLTHLYDLINLNRLRNNHAESAATVKSKLKEVLTLMITVQENFAIVPEESSEARTSQYQSLVAIHRDIKHQMTACEEAYDDLCGYYSFMQMQGEMDISLPTQAQVDTVWTTIRQESSNLAALVVRHARWGESYDSLDRLYCELKLSERELEMSDSAVPDASILDSVEKRMREVSRSLEALASMTQNVMSVDSENAVIYTRHHALSVALSRAVQTTLSEQKLIMDRILLAESFGADIKRLCSLCEEQLSFIKQRTMNTPDIHGKKSEAIKQIIKIFTSVLSTARDVYKRCKDEFEGTLSEQADRLTNTLDCSPSEVNRTKQPLERLLYEFDHTMKVEEEYCKSLNNVCRHAQLDNEVHKAMDDFKALVTRYARGALLRTKPSLLPDVTEFRRRYTLVEESIQNIYSVGNDLKGQLQKAIGVARMASIARNVDQRHEDIKKIWSEIKMLADETKVRLEETQRRQNAIAKLTECIRYVGDLKDRLNTLHFSGKSVAVEELELKGLIEEIDTSLMDKVEEADQLTALATDTDHHLKKLKTQLTQDIKELYALVELRQQHAKTEGNITLFMGMIDEVDEHISELLRTVNKATPHNSSITDDRLDKPELLQILRTFVTRFKTSESTITDLMVKARSEAQKQFLDDNARVSCRFEKTMERWTKAQAEATARQRELQMCLKQLNHDYFTKLATAKSTPRVKARTPPPGRPKTLRQSQTQGLGPNSTMITRRASLKSSGDLRSPSPGPMPMHRRAQTPVGTASRERQRRMSSYVADPKNELDVQLGKIVNESPYRMKIKMVQGQTGKYWFGDENPRLMYCRILPSQLVMVRVGGGWVELVRFLKDHGRNENGKGGEGSNVPSGLDVQTSASTPRGSAYRRISNASHNGMDSAYYLNASNGHMNGDKYIQTDEEGKQVVMKMKKAEDNAKMPSPKKKI